MDKLIHKLKTSKGIIFDMDGTLFDSLGIWLDIDRKFFSLFNMVMPVDYDKRISHMSFEEMAVFTKNEYKIPISVEEIMSLWIEWSKEAYLNEIKEKKYVKDVLSILKERGYILSLATTNKKELYLPCLRRTGLDSYFTYITNTNDLNTTKSEPKIYLDLIDKMKISKSETIVFEDIYQAIKTCHDENIFTVAVYDIHNKIDENRIKNLCDYYLNDFKFLFDELKK